MRRSAVRVRVEAGREHLRSRGGGRRRPAAAGCGVRGGASSVGVAVGRGRSCGALAVEKLIRGCIRCDGSRTTAVGCGAIAIAIESAATVEAHAALSAAPVHGHGAERSRHL